METTTTSSFTYSSKFQNVINRRIEEKTNLDIANYNFKARENIFSETSTGKEMNNLNGFNALTVLYRFFYTIENTNETYISNIIVDEKTDRVSLYNNKSKILNISGKTEFTFDELEKLSFDIKGLNRKIILVGIYEGRLTKIETQVTSEKTVLLFLKNNTTERTADISGVEKKYKENTTNILNLVKSRKQLSISLSEENEYFQELDKHISGLNQHLTKSSSVLTETNITLENKVDEEIKVEKTFEEVQKSSEEYAINQIKEQEEIVNIQEEIVNIQEEVNVDGFSGNSEFPSQTPTQSPIQTQVQTSIPLDLDYSSQNL